MRGGFLPGAFLGTHSVLRFPGFKLGDQRGGGGLALGGGGCLQPAKKWRSCTCASKIITGCQRASYTITMPKHRATWATCVLQSDFLVPWEVYGLAFNGNLRVIPEKRPELDGELLIIAKWLFHILSIEGEYLLAISFREESLIFP
jgi:hypothetical protein